MSHSGIYIFEINYSQNALGINMASFNPLDSDYQLITDIDTYFVDKDTGLPLAGGILTFYSAADQVTPQDVYTLTGTYDNPIYVNLGNVIILSAVGTPQDDDGNNVAIYGQVYTDGQWTLYYVKCTDSAGTPQFTRLIWPNETTGGSPTPGNSITAENQIANPTFTKVFTNAGLTTTYTVTGTLQTFYFAPNWDFVINGTGTVNVTVTPLAGDLTVPTNPPYIINVNVVGPNITQCWLRQRFFNNSGVWSSTDSNTLYLYGSFLGQNAGSGTAAVQMFYVESSGTNPPQEIIGTGQSFGTNYTVVSSYVQMLKSLNSQSGFNAYTDIYLSFTQGSNVNITSIQLIPSLAAPASSLPFDTNSSNRDQALLGDYYIPRASKKQIDSYLTGWDFPVNPYQTNGTSGTVTTTAAYICDQTIAKSATSNVTWEQDSTFNSLRFTGTGTNDAFYVLQYLSAGQVYNMIGNNLSVNLSVYSGFGTFTMRVYLYASASAIPALTSGTIGTIAANGVFTPTAAGWTTAEIPRNGLPTPQVTVTTTGGPQDFGFSGWTLPVGPETNFAIVVTFQYATTNTVITVNSISCVPGDLPCRPAIKSAQATLAECQYYYETAGNSTIMCPQSAYVQYNITTSANTIVATQSPFQVNYVVPKRTAPIFTFGSPDMAWRVYIQGVVTTGTVLTSTWTEYTNTSLTVNYVPNTAAFIAQVTAATPMAVAACITFNYIADCRLGII